MPAEFVCPSCQGRWESSEPDGGPCPYCRAVIAAPDAPPPAREDAIQEGAPPVEAPDEYLAPLQGDGYVAIVCALVALSGFVDLWQMFTELDKAAAIQQALAGGGPGLQWDEAQRVANLLGFAAIVLFVVGTIVTWLWFRSAHRNLVTLEVTGVKYAPGPTFKAALAPWRLVYVPYGAIQELWLASHPALKRDPDAWKRRSPSRLIQLWWFVFLLRHVRINIVIQPFPTDPVMLNVLLWAAWISAIACVMGAVASVLFIIVILWIEHRQGQRYNRLVEW